MSNTTIIGRFHTSNTSGYEVLDINDDQILVRGDWGNSINLNKAEWYDLRYAEDCEDWPEYEEDGIEPTALYFTIGQCTYPLSHVMRA